MASDTRPEEPASAAETHPTPIDVDAPAESSTSPSTSNLAGGLTVGGQQVQVFASSSTPTGALDGSKTPSDLDESFFEPTLSDVQAHHASVIARSKRLNEAPLLTAKHRDEERAERDKRKAEKWPTTTIRVRFSDGMVIQSTFPSSSPIQPVYAFIRASLAAEASTKPFVLWQPPRFTYPEHPVPVKKPSNPYKTTILAPANYGPVRGGPTQGLTGGTGGRETLNELGLVPQSVLLVKWDDESMNASGFTAPLLPELLSQSQPLPPPTPKDAAPPPAGTKADGKSDAKGEKKIPKYVHSASSKRSLCQMAPEGLNEEEVVQALR